SGGASGLLGGTPAAADAPGSLKNDDPLARPVAVAWTSARAQRCGFYFNPAKLRSSYLAYEARRSGPEQVAQAEKVYDSTFNTIRDKVAADPGYCTDGKSAEIKRDLTRHLAGDFAASFPKPKVAESSCMLFCGADTSDQAWDAKKFWAEQDKKNYGGR
ncbi:MAG: hypothetical protein J2P50_19485, partial [Hyphomicrobiaceae bacterium]|nr:hypothetical protein [Hyphomicrobiaceae bacterium]